jgi:hypothetical protein
MDLLTTAGRLLARQDKASGTRARALRRSAN